MSALCRSFVNVGKKCIFAEFGRSITVSAVTHFKEINSTKVGNTLTIEAKIIPDPDNKRLIKLVKNGKCPLCTLGLDVKHTDVLILSQFLRPDGCILPKRVTHLCSTQQKRLESLVAMSQKSGLMPNLTPSWSKKDPKKRFQWKKYNKYFDESTIKAKYSNSYFRE